MLIKDNINTAQKISSPADVMTIMASILSAEDDFDRDKEHFWTIGLTCNNRVKYIELVTLGVLGMTVIHPREVFRMAISQAVNSILLVHNHPSGDLRPSKEDDKTTNNLKNAGEIIEIKVLDHIIIGKDGYYSYSDNGYKFIS